MQTEQILTWFTRFEGLLPIVVVGIAAFVVVMTTAIAILDGLDFRRLVRRKRVYIELTPSAHEDKVLMATEHLFSVLHGMEESRPFFEKVLRRKVVFSTEIVSTRETGIRYIIVIVEARADVVEQALASYLPEAKLRRIDDYLPAALGYQRARTMAFRQTGHFAYPLKSQLALEQHDPVAYLNGAMTQLEPGELVAFQIVMSPATIREAQIVQHKLAHNELLVTQLGRQQPFVGRLFSVINSILFGLVDLIGDIFHGPSQGYNPNVQAAMRRQEIATRAKPARTLSALEQQLATSVDYKLQQPLFRANVRVLVVMGSTERVKQRMSGLRNALDALKTPGYQSLKARFSFPARIRERYRFFAFTHRLPAFLNRSASILASSEVTGIYHFPNSLTAKTENVVKSLSKTLPAPLSLKQGKPFDVVLGRNHHLGASADIGLTPDERERHVFVVGGTGNGKTTMLKYAIIQDIQSGKGVAVLDPHGDLAQELLEYIPAERLDDVIYFNPADLSYPVGLNLLELPEGLNGDPLLDAKDFIAETVVSIMRKTFSDDGTGGHRIEYVLRNAVLTALTIPDATLFTVYDLLTDDTLRKPIVNALEQDWLKQFWLNEYGKAGDYQQVKMMAGVTAKIGRYHASASADRILSQPKSTINFDEILDGKILICNLAKGLIGEDTSEVFGISILAKLQLASFQRIKQKRVDRRPFYTYVDEFQNFATVSFVEMLSEARKYKLFLTMAEQTTAQQQDQRIVNTILTNAGTIICFKTNSPADEQLMLQLLDQQVQPGEIMNLPTYNFYIRLAGTEPQMPTSGMTLLLDIEGDSEMVERVIAASRANYAIEFKQPEKAKATRPKAPTRSMEPEKSDSKGRQPKVNGTEVHNRAPKRTDKRTAAGSK